MGIPSWKGGLESPFLQEFQIPEQVALGDTDLEFSDRWDQDFSSKSFQEKFGLDFRNSFKERRFGIPQGISGCILGIISSPFPEESQIPVQVALGTQIWDRDFSQIIPGQVWVALWEFLPGKVWSLPGNFRNFWFSRGVWNPHSQSNPKSPRQRRQRSASTPADFPSRGKGNIPRFPGVDPWVFQGWIPGFGAGLTALQGGAAGQARQHHGRHHLVHLHRRVRLPAPERGKSGMQRECHTDAANVPSPPRRDGMGMSAGN